MNRCSRNDELQLGLSCKIALLALGQSIDKPLDHIIGCIFAVGEFHILESLFEDGLEQFFGSADILTNLT